MGCHPQSFLLAVWIQHRHSLCFQELIFNWINPQLNRWLFKTKCSIQLLCEPIVYKTNSLPVDTPSPKYHPTSLFLPYYLNTTQTSQQAVTPLPLSNAQNTQYSKRKRNYYNRTTTFDEDWCAE